MAAGQFLSEDRAPAATTAASGDALLLVASVGARKLAFPAGFVERVLQMAEFAPVADPALRAAGVLNVHGETVPVVDARPLLGEASAAARADQHLVLMAPGGRFAVWVDRVERLVTPGPGDVQPLGDAEDGDWMLRLDAGFIPIIPLRHLSPYETPPEVPGP